MTLPLILDLAIKGSLLVALAAAFTLLGRGGAAAQRHLVWVLALGGLVALPFMSTTLPWRLPVLPFLSTAPAPAAEWADALSRWPAESAPRAVDKAAFAPTAEAVAAAVRAEQSAARAVEAAQAADLAVGPPPAALRLDVSLLTVLKALWLAGAALVLARLVAGLAGLRRVLRDATDVADRDWLELLASTAERLDLRRPVRLVESPHVATPMAFGIWRPVVALPVGASAWPLELRESVLLHELAHVRRGDVRFNLVAQAACALYWFNPLVWGAARRLRIEAERACDDLVLAGGADASDYAAHLLEMAQVSAQRRAPVLAVPMAQPSAFEGRVLAILNPRQVRHGVTRRAAAFGVLALLLVTVPLAALAPAQDDGRRRDRERMRVREERRAMRELERLSRGQFDQARLASQIQAEVARAQRETFRAQADLEREIARQVAEGVSSAQLVEARAAMEAHLARETHAQQERRNPAISLALAAALQDSLEDVRVVAARALAEHGDSVAINALLAALRRDASKEVRKTAAWALGEIEDERAVQGLIAALADEQDREVRNTIVWALGEIESATAVQGLGALLSRERDPEIRRSIVWALGEIESPDAVPFLTTVIRDPDPELREKTVWALGEIESPAAIEPLTAMLSTERNPATREMIVWALGEIEDPRAAPALESVLRDTSVGVRRKAVWALGELDNLRAAPAGLIAATRDDDVETRRAAVHALGEIADPAAVPALTAALRDTDIDVRRFAIYALGETPGTAAVEALVAAMRDPDPEIRRAAARALGDR